MPYPDFCYASDTRRFPAAWAAKFVALGPDPALHNFMARLSSIRAGRVRTSAQRALRHLASDFDINGLLGLYSMHLLSTEQWRALLGPAPIPLALDVGAGSGDVTRALAPLCQSIQVTEVSRVMARRLRRLGFICQRRDVVQAGLSAQTFDLISCLNVLDRCERPRGLLQCLSGGLRPGGRLALALVLPYEPFFYRGPTTPEPLERLRCTGKDWEAAAAELIEHEFLPLGLELEAFTRAPYLSSGDSESDCYYLDALIVILRAA